MKKLLFVWSLLFLLTACTAVSPGNEIKSDPMPASMPSFCLENCEVTIWQGDYSVTGICCFTSEQLFSLSIMEPDTLTDTLISCSPASQTIAFASLSAPLPSDSPIFLFYRALCDCMEISLFTKTENGFIRDVGGQTLSVIFDRNTVTLLTENIQAQFSSI